jgi:excisionase family DNA binding protein
MRLPIDTQSVKFAAAGPAEPVLDYESRAPKTDENGVVLFNVPIFASGEGGKNPNPPTRLLLTILESARVLGVSRTTVYALMNSGRLTSVNIGRSRRSASTTSNHLWLIVANSKIK